MSTNTRENRRPPTKPHKSSTQAYGESPNNEQRATNNYQLTTNNYQLTTNNYQLSTINYQLSTKPFTLIELLVVMAVIGILAAMLMPAIQSAWGQVKRSATKTEIQNMEAAMTQYYRDWGAYPPDDEIEGGSASSAECLVYYLGTPFRAGENATKNGGPYYEFEPARRVDEDEDGYDVYVDPYGKQGRNIYYYRYDNNVSDTKGTTGYSNVHPSGIDIWSAGPNGEDFVTQSTPTQDAPGNVDGDDVCNWKTQ